MEVFFLFIEYGLDVNEVIICCIIDSSSFSYIFLMLVVEKGYVGCIYFLLNKGGKLNKGNEIGWLFLYLVVVGDYINVVKFFIEKGRNWNELLVICYGIIVFYFVICLELVRLFVE